MNVYQTIKQLEKMGYRFTVKDNKINYHLVDDVTPDPAEVKPLFNIIKNNKQLAVDILSITGKTSFNEYLQCKREKSKYNPRPDIKEDSHLWQQVLKEAEKVDKQLYSNLHGCRCGGARLEINKSQLRLLPCIGPGKCWETKDEWQESRRKYLLPYTEEIKNVFSKVVGS